jgi:hypothetical protein
MAASRYDDDGLSLWKEYELYCRLHPGVPDEYDDWVIDNHLQKRSSKRKKHAEDYEADEF